MQRLGCDSMDAYLAELEKPDVKRECERLMTVSISRFFRDGKLWEALRENILPELIERCGKDLKVWSAGCAGGEEVYSFRIVWEEMKKRFERLPELKLTGTDMNPDNLERCRAGIYPPSSLKEVPDELKPIYFDKIRGKKSYSVKSRLRSNISWRPHHLLSDPVGSGFHIIFLRNNLLTYYEDGLKLPALAGILESLSSSGFLIIGSNEKLALETEDFVFFSGFSFIFKKH